MANKKKGSAKNKKEVIEEVKEEIKKENKSFKKIYFVTSYERAFKINQNYGYHSPFQTEVEFETVDYTLTAEEAPEVFAILAKYDAQKKELDEAKKTILEMKAAIKKVNDFSGE